MIDYDGTRETNSKSVSVNKGTESNSGITEGRITANSKQSKASGNEDNDDVFSDSDGEESGSSRGRQTQSAAGVRPAISSHLSNPAAEKTGTSKHGTHQLSAKNSEPLLNNAPKDIGINGVGKPSSGLDMPETMGASDIKAIAADASVFSFGDEDDYESE